MRRCRVIAWLTKKWYQISDTISPYFCKLENTDNHPQPLLKKEGRKEILLPKKEGRKEMPLP